MGAGWVDEGWVFARPDGVRPHPHVVYRSFKRAVKAAGLRDISLHGLRHTSAPVLLARGAHPKVVQTRLGHSDIRVTLDTYSHLIGGLDEDAATEMGTLSSVTTTVTRAVRPGPYRPLASTFVGRAERI